MDIARIRKLAGLSESPQSNPVDDYDFGHRHLGNKGTEPYQVAPDYHGYKGRADMKNRVVNNQGDNPEPNGEGNDELEGGLGNSETIDEASQTTPAEDYDFGHRHLGNKGLEPYQVAPDYHGYLGRADMKNRVVNNQGDNPEPNGEGNDKLSGGLGSDDDLDESFLREFTDEDEFSLDDLDKLHEILSATGINDASIRAGALTPSALGYVKLAKKLGKGNLTMEQSRSLVNGMLLALANQIGYDEADDPNDPDDVEENVEINEHSPDGVRFAWMQDRMGNVTITDAETGKKVYLQGSEASSLMRDIEQCRLGAMDEQDVLAAYVPMMESKCEVCEGDGGRYDDVYEWEPCPKCTGDGMLQDRPVLIDENDSDVFEFCSEVERPDENGDAIEVPISIKAVYQGGDVSPALGLLGRTLDQEPEGASVEIVSVHTDAGEPIELTPREQEYFRSKGLAYYENKF